MSSQAGSPLGLLSLTSNSKVAETLDYSRMPNTKYQLSSYIAQLPEDQIPTR